MLWVQALQDQNHGLWTAFIYIGPLTGPKSKTAVSIRTGSVIWCVRSSVYKVRGGPTFDSVKYVKEVVT